MPNGKPGDNPLSDMLLHGAHPFPGDIEERLRRMHALDPQRLNELAYLPFEWERGESLEEARELLDRMLEQLGHQRDDNRNLP